MTDYILVLARAYPNVQASCVGDPSVYSNLVWEAGDALPSQEDLDIAHLQQVIDDKWLQIKEERDKRKGGGVQVGAYWLHSDDTSRIQQIGLVMMGASIPSGLMWKTMTGEFVEMTPTLAGQVFQAIATYDTLNFANAETHRQAMMVAEDPASYDFSSGWITCYLYG